MNLEFLRIFKAWTEKRKDGSLFTTIQTGRKSTTWKDRRNFESVKEAIDEAKTVRSKDYHIEFIADLNRPPYKENKE